MHLIVLTFCFLAASVVNWSYIQPEDYQEDDLAEFHETRSYTGLEQPKLKDKSAPILKKK